ncbi:hypothetical protein P154DRAFT_472627 [Amniculicola lignicola CBS 123094]|uniref:Rhodopsin domain-containing protein n=1 Tax=Amniculicola lignicola CBS 123094 TaxID=1392246 RepID=A0A6A5WFN2_9PLEO|nr:hypothetical protein P154DRAFT_472627 [Amniculicola lignicola CBS 123094]
MSQYAQFKMPPGGDRNKGPALEAATIITFCLAAIIVAVRIYYRAFRIKTTAWDDYTIVLALVSACVSTAFILKYVEAGGGRHAVYLQMKAVDVAKWSTISTLPFIISTTLTKISIALMILRISNSRKLKWSMIPLMVIVTCINLTGIVLLAAGCRPFEANWNYAVPRTHCWPRKVLKDQNFVQGIVSIVSDCIYTALPVVVVWGLNISRRQKVGITFLVALGLVATACSIARLVLYETFDDWTDSTWGLSDLQIWTALEQNLGIVAASLPTLRIFFKEIGATISSLSFSFSGGKGSGASLSEELTGKDSGSDRSDSSTIMKTQTTTVKSIEPFDEQFEMRYLGGAWDIENGGRPNRLSS